MTYSKAFNIMIPLAVLFTPEILSAQVLANEIQIPQPAFIRNYISPSASALEEAVRKSWCCSRPVNKTTSITVTIGEDGQLFNPTLVSSDDYQHDAECLEAVLQCSPVNPAPMDMTGVLKNSIISFDKDLKPAFDGAEISEYLKSHPQPSDPKDAFVVIHRIPVRVLEAFPGMFTKEEILSQNNLVEIRGADRLSHTPRYIEYMARIYRYWSDVFKNSTIDKATILKKAQLVPFGKTW